jgi:hypothetical protein
MDTDNLANTGSKTSHMFRDSDHRTAIEVGSEPQ